MATIKLKFRPSIVDGKDGTLFFQIIHFRQIRQINTNLRISREEWDATNTSIIISSADSQRTMYLSSINKSLKNQQAKLSTIISILDNKASTYTAQDVVSMFFTPVTILGVGSFIRNLINELKKIGKESAAKRLEKILNSLLRYTDGNEVIWKDLTSTFILGYETFMIKRGLCRNSTSFYMRNLRSIVNRAIGQGIEVPSHPFKYVYMGVDKTVKRAISLDMIRMIRDVDLNGNPELDFARNVFMFAFYTRGMSFIDIAFLKKSDLQNGVLTYFRRKTRQQLMVKIEPETRKVIERLGKSKTSFLLPIITEEKNIERQYESAYYRVNRNIRKVGEMLGLQTKLTLYVARHTWASIAHANNVALSTISKAMGHDSEKTTIIYLQTLDSSSVDKANRDIIRMMNNGPQKDMN
ncbi:MAG: site-specific integrase [Prevotella sp.]|nr:site-specific integrase [Prevotella sp.]